MSLRKNIIANYASQSYATLVGIIMVPMYVKFMGAEAYGLVGFFALLQSWFTLLDPGLTQTMARESARFCGGASDALSYRRFVRALEGIFLAVALIGGGTIFGLSKYLAYDWLKVSQLPTAEVQSAVQLMAAIVAMRWMCGLYRGAISGSERLVWLGGYNTLFATLRFVAVFPILIFVGVTPTIFFTFQCGVAALELAGLVVYAYQLMPSVADGRLTPWSWAPLKPVLKFSLTIAFTSSVWVIVTQTDKLVLSRILPLAEYGYFTLAVLVAGGVLVISGPVSGAIMPRMSKLEAEGHTASVIQVYRQATQLVAVIASAASIAVAVCAEPLLWAWTGDGTLAHRAAPVLALYALGNGILAVSAFPYYLQYAKGDLRLHLIGNAAFVVLLIPAIILTASKFGGVGAGYVWLSMNLLTFVAWLPFVHRKFEKGLNAKWYIEDIGSIFLPAAIAGACVWAFEPRSDSRSIQLLLVACGGFFVLGASALGSSQVRSLVLSRIGK